MTTPLGSLQAEEIDRHLIVNVRATLLLVRRSHGRTTPPLGGGQASRANLSDRKIINLKESNSPNIRYGRIALERTGCC